MVLVKPAEGCYLISGGWTWSSSRTAAGQAEKMCVVLGQRVRIPGQLTTKRLLGSNSGLRDSVSL